MSSLYLLAVLCILSTEAQYFDYYWRDYYGVIPGDALVGGQDINGENVYIGQAYIHGLGLSVGRLSPGVTQISVPFYGVKKTDHLIKVLCTKHPNNFVWFRTTANTFHVDTIGKHAVIGGYDLGEPNKGILHIGRVMHQGEIKFGNVAAYDPINAWFYFPVDNTEKRASSYEVLIYQNTTISNTIPVDLRYTATKTEK